MYSLLLAVLLTLCLLPGLSLRCIPFAPLVTPAQRRTLCLWYGIACVGNVVLLYLAAPARLFSSSRIIQICSVFPAVTTLINLLVIRGHIREQLFTLGIVINCHYLLTPLPAFVIEQTIGMDTVEACVPALLLYAFLLLLAYRPIRRLLNHTVTPFLTLDSGNYWNTIWFIPLALYGAFLFINRNGNDVASPLRLFSNALLAAVVLLMSLSIAADHKRLTERQQLNDQLNAQKLHYAQLQAKMEEARKYKHDFQHHVTAIQELAAADDVPAILSYCDNLVTRSRLYDHIPYTGNPAADGILYRYTELAREHEIDFSVSGSLDSAGIEDIDLCGLLGNALENALAGCLTITENRSIRVVLQNEPYTLSILVQNTFDGRIRQTDDGLLSRKRSDRTGVGLRSMRSVCERYNGAMDTQWDDTTFTVLLILPHS